MPLDHFIPSDTRTIDVTFAVKPATGARKGAFVTATGGPGYSGISVADYYTSFFEPSVPRRFDLVFFDQRGLALSGGLTCPEAAPTFYRTDSQTRTPAQERAFAAAARRFSTDCPVEAGRTDLLPYLGTAQAAEDLESFRLLLQDDRWWLYGESYGTQLSQTYAAAHPEHLGGLVLDGTVDLTLDGPGFYVEQARAFSDVLAATMAGCDTDAACAADGGGGIGVYDRLAARLARGPIPFDFPLADGTTVRRDFRLTDLETVAAGQVYSQGDRMLLQRAMAGAAHGDLVPLARLLYPNLGLDPQTEEVISDPTYSDAIYYGVECQDYSLLLRLSRPAGHAYLRAGNAVEASVPRLASIFYGDLPCPFWPHASTDPARPAPLVANGVPTLVLGADTDPATPYGNGVSRVRPPGRRLPRDAAERPPRDLRARRPVPDDLVTAFLVQGRRPDRRRTTCPGPIADPYVAVAPASAAAFPNVEAALASAETEISYLPEYYYWDGVEPTATGCPDGGTLGLTGDGATYDLALDGCAFSRGFAMTGRGRYDSDRDRFELHVRGRGPHRLRGRLRPHRRPHQGHRPLRRPTRQRRDGRAGSGARRAGAIAASRRVPWRRAMSGPNPGTAPSASIVSGRAAAMAASVRSSATACSSMRAARAASCRQARSATSSGSTGRAGRCRPEVGRRRGRAAPRLFRHVEHLQVGAALGAVPGEDDLALGPGEGHVEQAGLLGQRGASAAPAMGHEPGLEPGDERRGHSRPLAAWNVSRLDAVVVAPRPSPPVAASHARNAATSAAGWWPSSCSAAR